MKPKTFKHRSDWSHWLRTNFLAQQSMAIMQQLVSKSFRGEFFAESSHLSDPHHNQWDHTRRNFAALAKCLKYFVILRGYICIRPIFEPTLGNLSVLVAYFHCNKWPNIGKIIFLSGHTAHNNHQQLLQHSFLENIFVRKTKY